MTGDSNLDYSSATVDYEMLMLELESEVTNSRRMVHKIDKLAYMVKRTAKWLKRDSAKAYESLSKQDRKCKRHWRVFWKCEHCIATKSYPWQ